MFIDLDLSAPEARRRAFPAVDIAKFVCAVLVVMVHTNPFGDIQPDLAFGTACYLARIAVPFFFVAGGYFCFRKTAGAPFDGKPVYAYVRRLILLYVIWLGVFLLPILYAALHDPAGIAGGLWAFVRKAVLAGYDHLWYLKSAAVGTLLVANCLRLRMKPWTVCLLALGLLCLGLLGDTYYGLVRDVPVVGALVDGYTAVFFTTRNGLFFGFLYVAMGMLFAYRRITMKGFAAVAGFLVSLLLAGVEAFVVRGLSLAKDYKLYVFMVPAVFFLFYLVTHLERRETPCTQRLRTYSSLVYYTHQYVTFLSLTVITSLMLRMGIRLHSLLQFAIVLGGALLASMLVTVLERHRPFRWLKKMH